MNFSLFALTLILSSVSGDLFKPCAPAIDYSKTWCLGVKKGRPSSRKGQGCFVTRDCDALVFAEFDPSIDRVYWTIAGHETEPFDVMFYMTHFPSKSIQDEDIIYTLCGNYGPQDQESLVVFLEKETTNHTINVDGEDAYEVLDEPGFEVIGGMNYTVCEYISKTHIFFKNETLGYDYDVNLVSQKIIPNLVLYVEGKGQLGKGAETMAILVYVPPPYSSKDKLLIAFFITLIAVLSLVAVYVVKTWIRNVVNQAKKKNVKKQ